MSKWDERIQGHPVAEKLDELDTQTAELDTPSSVSELAEVERLRRVVRVVREAMQSADPELLPIAVLNALAAPTDHLLATVDQYRTAPQPQLLEKANAQADTLLNHLPTLRAFSQNESLSSEDMSSYRRSAAQYLRRIEEERDDLLQTVTETTATADQLATAIEAQKGRLDQAIADFQRQFSEAQEGRVRSSESAESARTKAFEELVGEVRAELGDVQATKKRQDAESSKQLEDHRSQFEEMCDELRTDQKKRLDELQQTADGRIKKIDALRTKAEQLVGVITDTGMVGGYQRTAKAERAAYVVWQLLAIGGLVGLLAYAIDFSDTVVASQPSEAIDWSRSLSRAFVAACFGLFGTYAGRQAHAHRRAELTNRRMELELASIAPYLLELPEQKQHELREELAKRLFGQASVDESKDDTGATGSILAELLKEAIRALGKAADR